MNSCSLGSTSTFYAGTHDEKLAAQRSFSVR
jgi:hypothetical protein